MKIFQRVSYFFKHRYHILFCKDDDENIQWKPKYQDIKLIKERYNKIYNKFIKKNNKKNIDP